MLDALDRDDRARAARGTRRLHLRGRAPGPALRGVGRLHGGRLAATRSPTSSSAATRTSSPPDGAATAAGRCRPRPRSGRTLGRSEGAREEQHGRAADGARRRAHGPARAACVPTKSALARPRRSASTGNARRTWWRRSKRRSPSCAQGSERRPRPMARAPKRRWATCCSRSPTSSRKLGIEPESALRKANEKFTRRFSEAGVPAAGDRAARSPSARSRRWKTSGARSSRRNATRPPARHERQPPPGERRHVHGMPVRAERDGAVEIRPQHCMPRSHGSAPGPRHADARTCCRAPR